MRAKRKAIIRRRLLVRFYIILFIVLFLVFGLAILSGNPKLIVKDFVVTGNNSVSTNDILKIVNQDTTGRYFGLFARNNFLLFPRFKIERDLLANIKTLKTVDLSWSGWQVVTIEVSERKPHAVWCDTTCNFMDESGFVYSPAPTFTGSIYVKYYGQITDYQTLFKLISLLAKRGLEVNSVTFDNVDYRFLLSSGPTIIFNDKAGGFDAAFTNLFTALDSKDLDLLNNADKIDYVDLRFDSKIVVGNK